MTKLKIILLCLGGKQGLQFEQSVYFVSFTRYIHIPYGWSEAFCRLYVIRALGYFCYSIAVFGDY